MTRITADTRKALQSAEAHLARCVDYIADVKLARADAFARTALHELRRLLAATPVEQPAAAPNFSVEWLSTPRAGNLYAAPQPAQADARVGLTDAQIIETFEREIHNDPDAYTRPDECVYQITAKELVRAARALLAADDRA